MDEHSLDQLIIYMALAQGQSRVRGPPRGMVTSLHVATAVHMGTCVRTCGIDLFCRIDPIFARLVTLLHKTQHIGTARLTHAAEAITGVRFTQREEDGTLFVEVAAPGGMGFASPPAS